MKDLALPQLLQEIADAVGIEAAFAVAAAKGGTRPWIHRNPADDNWMVKAVGPEKARLIGEAICGDSGALQVLIPMGPAHGSRRRWKEIIRLHDEERLSNADIARRMGCHEKTVERIIGGKRKTVKAALAQADFFD